MSGFRNLIEEIHRRSLWQVLGIYLFGSWAAYQGVVALYEGLGLPDWVPPMVIVLFLVGLPVVLATAFVQQGGPRATPARAEVEPAHVDPLHYHELELGVEGTPPHPLVAATRPGWVRGLLTWNRAILGGVLAFAVLGIATTLFMGMRALGVGPVGTLVAAGVLDARERVILGEFATQGGDTLLASAAAEAFRVDFEQSPIVTVVDAGFVRQVLERMQRAPSSRLSLELAREVAVREGIKAVIAGEINPAGRGYVLSARLVTATTGEVLGSYRETAPDSSAILPAIDKLSKKLRERIGESLKSIRSNPRLDQVSTSSLEALRKYSQALRASDLEGNVDRSAALLEEAVALDSTFAMAWRKLGVARQTLGVDFDRTVHALVKAYEHRDRLTDRERYLTLGTYYDVVTSEHDKAINAYLTLIDSYPNEHTALHNLGRLHSLIGDLPRANEFYRRAMAADSSVSVTYLNLIATEFALNGVEPVQRVLAAFAARFPSHPRLDEYRAGVAYHADDLAGAERLVRAMREAQRGSARWRAQSSGHLLSLALLQGRLAEAERHASDVAAANEQRGQRSARIGQAMGRARSDIELRGVAPAQALARVHAALEQSPLADIPVLDRPYVELAALFAYAGQPARARTLMEEYTREAPAEQQRAQRAFQHFVSGEIHRVEGRYDEALREHRLVREAAPNCRLCSLLEIGQVHELAGRPDSAIAAYEQFLEERTFGRLGWDALGRPRAYQRLSDLYDQRGDRARATDYYAKLLALWEKADPELKPRVDALRSRLQQLTAEGGR